MPLHPSTLLLNARLFTNTSRRGTALAIRGERIIAVGEEAQILALRGPRTRVCDLGGRLVTSGFTDSHVHLRGLARHLSDVRLEAARTLAEAVRRVAARVRTTPKGHWITGGGFDKNQWGDEFPTRHDLDIVAPEHPVALRARDGHTFWLNSPAMKACGITRRTQTPTGGLIRHDHRGQPTGILQETATRLVRDCPAYLEGRAGPEEVRRALRHLLRLGLTSVHAMDDLSALALFQDLRERGRLQARLTVYPYYVELDDLLAAGLRSGSGDEWLRIGGVKLLLDGTLGSQTAWLFAPHANSDAGCGLPLMSRRDLRAALRRAAEHGFACAIHAIGDRANAEALDALEGVSDLRTPLPHRIEHAQLLRPEDLPRFAQLGVIASMQPTHLVGDASSADRYWGARSRMAYAFASLQRAGASPIFGSDAPIETADVIAGLDAAVNRVSREGAVWYPQERVSLTSALRAYTLGPARATGEDYLKGKLAPGYLADLVVLSDDPIARRSLRDTRVDMVWMGGKLRFRRAGS